MTVVGKESLTLTWPQVAATVAVLLAGVWAILTWQLSDVREDVNLLVAADTETRTDMTGADAGIRETIHSVDIAVARSEANLENLSQQMRDGFASIEARMAEMNRVLLSIDNKLANASSPAGADGGLVMMSEPIRIGDWKVFQEAVQSYQAEPDEPIILWSGSASATKFLSAIEPMIDE